MSQKLFLNTGLETTKGGAIHALKDAGNAGAYDYAVLALTGVVVDQETFTLGDDVYEINVVATDTGSEIADAGGVAAADTTFIFDVAPTIPLLPGDVIRMESEFMIVVDYNVNGPSANVIRGAFGTTAAAHTKANSDTFQADQPVAAGNFAVPVSATTAATADDQIVAAVNFWKSGYSKGLGGGIGVKVQNGLKVDAFLAPGTTSVAFAYPANGGVATTAEAFTNGTITTFGGGVEPASQRYAKILHTVTAGDVSAGNVDYVAPWDVTNVYVDVFDDTTKKRLAWDGAVTLTGTRHVRVDNAGTTDWAADDTIVIHLLG